MRKLSLADIGNTYIQGSTNNVNWHDEITSSDNYFRITTDGADTWIALDTDFIPEGSNLYYTEARVSANADIVSLLSDQHTHSNLTALDNVVDSGGGTLFLADDGNYYSAASASSPLTTKGDIWVYGTTDQRLAVGTDGYVLQADSTEVTGLKWVSASLGTHASNHIDGGSDVIDADKLEITWIPSNYTRGITPTEVDAADQLTAHLYEHRGGECKVPDLIKQMASQFKLTRIGAPYMGVDFATQHIRSGSLPGGY